MNSPDHNPMTIAMPNEDRTPEIAIVGMSCLFPGAPDLDMFWQNILGKVDAITDPPAEAWDPEIFYDPDSQENDRVYCKRGGFISPLADFDPLKNGIMPKAVEGGEPDQWLALQIARAALADAGYTSEIPERQRTSVIIGRGTYLNRGNLSAAQHGLVIEQTLAMLRQIRPEYSEADLQMIRSDLKRQLPAFNADTAPALIPNIIAGRIANRLDLMGPTYTIDAACASSLLAIEQGVRDLRSGACDLALVGGAHVVTPVPVLMLFCQLNALSHAQRIRPFDKDADGTILGEGIGMIVLKRLSDAVRDNNRIYALVKGVGVASDGHGASVMAPRPEGEILALQRAYADAGVSPHTVGLVEAHGTGTPVGDAVEVESLTHVFGARSGRFATCALGSVKSMVGHLMPAAGIAGVIKASLALYHKILPPTLNVEEPLPQLRDARVPFYVNTEVRPWIHAGDTPRRAGVNAFGFGGINAHVVLEEGPAAETPFRHRHWDSELFVIGAESRGALIQQLQRLDRYLQANPETPLVDLAYTCNVVAESGPVRVALVAESAVDLQEKIQLAKGRLADENCRQIKDVRGVYFFAEQLAATGKLAFLFPGEGSQYPHMLADLCLHFPDVRARFDEIEGAFARHSRGFLPSDVIFPQPTFSEEERRQSEQRIWEMEGAVEAVLTANRAIADLLVRLGIRPDVIAGHSTGEYSAMIAAGMIDVEGEERLHRFCLEMNEIHQNAAADNVARVALVAVAAPSEKVSALLETLTDQVHVAMDNCPHQTVVTCDEEALPRVTAALSTQGYIYEQLPFDRPYHTPRFAAYADRFVPFFERWLSAVSQITTYSCTTISPFPADVANIRQVALAHWLEPVRFRQTLARMYEDGVRLFVEVGAGGNLTSFVADTLRGKAHLAIAANTKNRSGLTQLNHLVGMLAAQGVPVRLGYLYAHRPAHALDLDNTTPPAKTAGTTVKLKTGWPGFQISETVVQELQRTPPSAPATPDTEPLLQPVANYYVAETKEASQPMVTSAEVSQMYIGEKVNGDKVKGEYTHSNGQHAAALMVPQSTSAYPLVQAQPAMTAQPIVTSATAQVMLAHMRTMEKFLETQQAIMQAYLTGQTTTPGQMPNSHSEPAYVLPVVRSPEHSNGHTYAPAPAVSFAPPPAPVAPPMASAPLPATIQPPTAQPVPVQPAPAQPASENTALDEAKIHTLLLELISERTGYPADMLGPDLDLEADLGIDSIKRVEILGLFQQKSGFSLADHMEDLSKRKTLRAIVDFLAAHVGK